MEQRINNFSVNFRNIRIKLSNMKIFRFKIQDENTAQHFHPLILKRI